MTMDYFDVEEALLRLKRLVGVRTDLALAQLLGMEGSALNKRKTRGSFPKRELLALAQAKPDLGIDVRFVLTGQRTAAEETADGEASPAMGQRLTQERKALGLSQTGLAEQLGSSIRAVASWERGLAQPNAKYLVQADDLGLDVLYILIGRRKPVAPTPAGLSGLHSDGATCEVTLRFATPAQAHAFAMSAALDGTASTGAAHG